MLSMIVISFFSRAIDSCSLPFVIKSPPSPGIMLYIRAHHNHTLSTHNHISTLWWTQAYQLSLNSTPAYRVAQMRQRDCASSIGNFKGVGHFEAKFWVEALRVTFRANSYGPLDRRMAIIQLHHCKF